MRRGEDAAGSLTHQRVTTTDLTLWVWPYARKPYASSTTLSSYAVPKHCKISMRVFITTQNKKKIVELVQVTDIQTFEGYLERLPYWVENYVIARRIDEGLRKKFSESSIGRTSEDLIDREVSKSRDIQNNRTFITTSRV